MSRYEAEIDRQPEQQPDTRSSRSSGATRSCSTSDARAATPPLALAERGAGSAASTSRTPTPARRAGPRGARRSPTSRRPAHHALQARVVRRGHLRRRARAPPRPRASAARRRRAALRRTGGSWCRSPTSRTPRSGWRCSGALGLHRQGPAGPHPPAVLHARDRVRPARGRRPRRSRSCGRRCSTRWTSGDRPRRGHGCRPRSSSGCATSPTPSTTSTSRRPGLLAPGEEPAGAPAAAAPAIADDAGRAGPAHQGMQTSTSATGTVLTLRDHIIGLEATVAAATRAHRAAEDTPTRLERRDRRAPRRTSTALIEEIEQAAESRRPRAARLRSGRPLGTRGSGAGSREAATRRLARADRPPARPHDGKPAVLDRHPGLQHAARRAARDDRVGGQQTFDDWELILVDDCSPDDAGPRACCARPRRATRGSG